MSEKKLDKKKFLQRIIIVCWIALVVCFIIKLFGGNIFEIMCKNETFIKICTYADNHFWANYIISILYCFVSLYFFSLAIMQEWKFKKWQLLIVILTVLVGSALKIWNSIAGIIFDVWQGVLLQILLLGKQWRSYWKIIVANVLLIGFQLLSMFVRNLGITVLGENLLIDIIFSIDVLIMLVLYYAYSNIIKITKIQKLEKENENG